MRQKIMITVGLLAALGFVAGSLFHLPVLSILTKPLPVLLLVFTVADFPRTTYRNWVLVGLAFSVAGDIFLSAGDEMFLYGLVYFLIGHLAYIGAYISSKSPTKLLPLLLCIAWGSTAFLILKPNLGELMIPVVVYVAVICTMMWRASCCLGQGDWARLAFVGALLFVISDTILAFDRFYTPFAWAQVAVLVLYWSGQTAIALSARPVANKTG